MIIKHKWVPNYEFLSMVKPPKFTHLRPIISHMREHLVNQPLTLKKRYQNTKNNGEKTINMRLTKYPKTSFLALRPVVHYIKSLTT